MENGKKSRNLKFSERWKTNKITIKFFQHLSHIHKNILKRVSSLKKQWFLTHKIMKPLTC